MYYSTLLFALCLNMTISFDERPILFEFFFPSKKHNFIQNIS